MTTEARRPDHRTLTLLLLLACLLGLLPRALAAELAIPRAAGWIGLSSLTVLVATHRLGWRLGLASGSALAVLTALGVLCQGRPLAAILLMAGSAFCLGSTARWQCQGPLMLMMVPLCFVVAEAPVPLRTDQVLAFAGLLLLCNVAMANACGWIERRGGCLAPEPQVAHSWKRSLSYGVVLAGTTGITTAIALQHHWALMGGWLMLAPLMVMRPHARDSWSRALHRAVGTLLGVGTMHLLALIAPGAIDSPAIAIAFTTAAVIAMVRNWHHALFVVFLTGAVVLFNSSGHSVLAMAQERLEATLLGIGIALAMMALVEAGFRLRPADQGAMT